ncbi:MAG: geranylgeranyl reductase family protein [Bacteroidota bacterium]
MTKDADVIIAGAGPAGSIAAYQLAKAGVSVQILEKSEFPRYKVCGAGLTHKILSEIPFDVSPVVETKIHTFIFSSGFDKVFSRTSEYPLIYCTMRDKFDGYLLEKAVEAGAKVQFGEKVTSVELHDSYVNVFTRNRTFTSFLVIGAEGATGAVARSAKLWKDIKPGLAWEAEIRVDAISLKRYSDTVFLDWGAFPGGYGWVFPKGDHLSLGVGGPASLSKWMMDYYQKFLIYLEKSGIAVIETTSLKSWSIPVRVKRGNFHNGRAIVAGDAAGLTDPLTGEGIYYAIRSGKLAAEACISYLNCSAPSLLSYSKAVNQDLMTELLEANRIKNLFNTFPMKIHRFVNDSNRAWRAFGKVLRGEKNYADVRNGFGRWKTLWSLVCRMAHVTSYFAEKRFRKTGFP